MKCIDMFFVIFFTISKILKIEQVISIWIVNFFVFAIISYKTHYLKWKSVNPLLWIF